jgi:hypothetical protein
MAKIIYGVSAEESGHKDNYYLHMLSKATDMLKKKDAHIQQVGKTVQLQHNKIQRMIIEREYLQQRVNELEMQIITQRLEREQTIIDEP